VIVAYVSGHGYGHATRTAEVLRALRALSPELALAVVSAAPEWLFRRAIPGPLAFRSLECDVGLVQQNALVIDESATAESWRRFASTWDALAEREADWLRASGARLVLGDIPPLAFEAARRAGLPSVALANFSWDWVYRHLARREPGLAAAADACAEAYGGCGLLLRLPFAGDLSAFPSVEDVPLVVRRPGVSRAEARRRLGLGDDRPLVLLSFGGIGLPDFEPSVLDALSGYRFVSVGRAVTGSGALEAIASTALDAAGLGYQDLVGAADVVVTKPGYGIVSDAIGARTRLVYTDRGDFPEYPILVREMPLYLPIAYVSNFDLLAGRLSSALEAVRLLSWPAPQQTTGADVCAARLLARWAG
jgi:L-arabinokinase